jgi:hypothetical protein
MEDTSLNSPAISEARAAITAHVQIAVAAGRQHALRAVACSWSSAAVRKWTEAQYGVLVLLV